MRIDSHHHLWTLSRGDYGWMSPEFTAIYRDFTPDDLAPHLRSAGITKTVVVQAADTVAETEFLLGLADQVDWIAGVVGWVDFEDPDVGKTLARLAQNPKFKGVRPMIQDIADDDWILSDRLDPAFDAISDMVLCFDALVLPRHLTRLARRLERHPDLACVIDHGAKPDLKSGDIEAWRTHIARIANTTQAFCKLSGLLTEARPGAVLKELEPATRHLLDVFGPERLMFGSDWPVLDMASDYGTWVSMVETLLEDVSDEQKAAIWGQNAIALYRLDLSPLCIA
ncbi:amidohydrolase family protein [uncultured Tateyamaria sp.]|uniref:amidohydrolase family protein n=1 Tax=uncultured Tateyamaria sp. TaxID=455651 RepID=UPI002639BB56|nr:amidohydrolase family protein [uncultured Tateyamaria sp.]